MGTVRESIWRVSQNSACLPPAKHSLNRPEFRVGLPKASQRIWVSSSVRAPSAVSHIRSWIAEASSIMRSRRFPLLCIPANASGFAGMHNKGKRLLLIMDEASAIHDLIWETAEGALTDDETQILWLAFGNPTRNSGRFKECFAGGKHAEFWDTRQIDSRTVPITNKARFDKWIKAYGADSDFVRVRVLGQFPRVGEMEFFSAADIDAAMSPDREVYVDLYTPLAIGVDVARFGQNNSVIFPRKGRDARSIPRQSYNGLSTVELANKVHETFFALHPDGIFIDGGGVGGGVVDQVRNQRLFCYEIQFGDKDDTTEIYFLYLGDALR